MLLTYGDIVIGLGMYSRHKCHKNNSVVSDYWFINISNFIYSNDGQSTKTVAIRSGAFISLISLKMIDKTNMNSLRYTNMAADIEIETLLVCYWGWFRFGEFFKYKLLNLCKNKEWWFVCSYVIFCRITVYWRAIMWEFLKEKKQDQIFCLQLKDYFCHRWNITFFLRKMTERWFLNVMSAVLDLT